MILKNQNYVFQLKQHGDANSVDLDNRYHLNFLFNKNFNFTMKNLILVEVVLVNFDLLFPKCCHVQQVIDCYCCYGFKSFG